MNNTIKLSGTSYIITRETEHPAFPGRYMVHLRRPTGTRLYVAMRYENGRYSSVSANPFNHNADASKMVAA